MGISHSRDIKYLLGNVNGIPVIETYTRAANGDWIPSQMRHYHAQKLEEQQKELEQFRQYQHQSYQAHQFQQQVQHYIQQFQLIQRMLPTNNFAGPAPVMAGPPMYQPNPYGYCMPNQPYYPGGFFR